MPERRVTHVVRSDGFAGVERYVCDTATELERRGWEVTVIGGDPDLMPQALPPAARFIPARTTAEVARAIWASGPTQVLHTHMTAAEAAAALQKGLRFERWVTTCHFARPRGSSSLGRAIRPLIHRRVDVQVAISRFVADAIDVPSIVIHNGVPASTEPPRDRDRTVVMMQRLEAEKDTAIGLRAWAASGLGGDGWRMRVFGRGSELDRLEKTCTDLGVTSSVSFEGFAVESRRVLAEAGLVLATAPAEPFGLTVVEAMAEGAAIVAADGGGHREALGDRASLFTPGDVDAAAHALLTLADDPDRRAHMGEELRQRHHDLFSVAHHVDQLERLYRA